jgi:transglutaminase-like putative cysteine protease
MRAAGIPARFEIGFPLPADRHDGAVPGYRPNQNSNGK